MPTVSSGGRGGEGWIIQEICSAGLGQTRDSLAVVLEQLGGQLSKLHADFYVVLCLLLCYDKSHTHIYIHSCC